MGYAATANPYVFQEELEKIYIQETTLSNRALDAEIARHAQWQREAKSLKHAYLQIPRLLRLTE